MDVMPVVDLGRQPAKATVGEPFPVRATVFREGHDQLAAEVVLTAPDGTKRPPVRMTKHERRPRPLRRLGDARRGRGVDLRDPRLVRPGRHLGARRRAQDPGRRRRGADVRGGQAPLREGARRGRRRHRRGQAAPGRDRGGGRPRPPAGGAAGASCRTRPWSPCWRRTRSASSSRSRAPTRRTPTAPRALFGSWYEFFPRSEGAHRRRRRQGRRAAPSRPRPSGSTRWPRWASTSSTCRRSTRSARSTARAPTTR